MDSDVATEADHCIGTRSSLRVPNNSHKVHSQIILLPYVVLILFVLSTLLVRSNPRLIGIMLTRISQIGVRHPGTISTRNLLHCTIVSDTIP